MEEPRWAELTTSPRPIAPGPIDLAACAGYDAALARVAEWVAERRVSGATPEMSEVVARLRAAGSPLVWPRVWTLAGAAFEPSQVAEEFARAHQREASGELRCGVARARADASTEVVAVVSAEVLADLEPLPSRARLGQWLRLRGVVAQAEQRARVVLLGPSGAPKTVPSQLVERELRASFSVDRAGLFRIQVLLDAGAGPRPALEAWVFVDEAPSLEAALRASPAEASGAATAAPAEGATGRQVLLAMINSARLAEGLLPLRPDSALDAVAQEHAAALSQAGRAAHDVGNGLPPERARRAGVSARRVGENVARAASLERAHRALWDSPSHRGNLLDPSFEAVGLGISASARHDASDSTSRDASSHHPSSHHPSSHHPESSVRREHAQEKPDSEVYPGRQIDPGREIYSGREIYPGREVYIVELFADYDGAG